MTFELLAGEREWLASIVANLADNAPKLVYADWLEEQGDSRATFLRQFVQAAETMNSGDFPEPGAFPKEWLDLIGYDLLKSIADENVLSLKEPALRLARPALRMISSETDEGDIPVGVSKIGGLPDLPADFAWPPGGDCHAIYNDDTGGTAELAGFLAQVNFAEIASTQAARDLPTTGVLSFFCFQDMENDNPDAIGTMTVFFPDTSKLLRTEPPKELTYGNETIACRGLQFEETLDLPSRADGPWSDELQPPPGVDYDVVLNEIRERNFENMLGYARDTTGDDPTPSVDSRHLILLSNSVECRLHIQILQENLSAGRFEKINLKWVDFD